MSSISTTDAPPTAARDADARAQEAPGPGSQVSASVVTINRDAQDLYAFWRDFANLPRVMENVDAIETHGPDRSTWTVKAPGGREVTWEAIVTDDRPGQAIAWSSTEESQVRNSGQITFTPVAGRGTVVRAVIAYDPPGGTIAQLLAKLFQREPAIQAQRDLRRFKQYMETGEVSTAARTRADATDLPAGPQA